MAFSLVAHAQAVSGNSNSVTTTGIDTSGANLIVINMAFDSTTTLSDSKSNTWTLLTNHNNGSIHQRLAYCFNPTVGSGHTFTLTGSSDFPSIEVQAWSGAATSPFDQENGAGATGSSVTPGSITPGQDNELVVSGTAYDNTFGNAALTAPASFTVSDGNGGAGGFAYGSTMGYWIQTTATAANPTWNANVTSGAAVAGIASFKAAAVLPGGLGARMIMPNQFMRTFSGQ